MSRCNSRMSLRLGSGWLAIYFLICPCTFICSAPSRAHEIIRRLILLNRSHSLSHRILEVWGHSTARAPRRVAKPFPKICRGWRVAQPFPKAVGFGCPILPDSWEGSGFSAPSLGPVFDFSFFPDSFSAHPRRPFPHSPPTHSTSTSAASAPTHSSPDS